MLLSSTPTFTRASHLISIGPDRACLELSEPPPSCTPIYHPSGTISKEQAPFQTDCPLSCLPTHGPLRIGFRLLLRHTSLSNHASGEAHGPGLMYLSPSRPSRHFTSPPTRSLLAPAGSARSRPGHNPAECPLLTQPIRPVLDFLYWRYIGQPQAERYCAYPWDRRTVSRTMRISQPSALPAAQPTRVDQRRALPTVHPPHCRLRDLPLVGPHCDARPAFAASEICLINVTPILCPLIPSDFR